jgi:hypothetical protein
MLPSRSPSLYAEVKVATDGALGLPSQVLVAPVAGVGLGVSPRGRLQYCNNLGERAAVLLVPAGGWLRAWLVQDACWAPQCSTRRRACPQAPLAPPRATPAPARAATHTPAGLKINAKLGGVNVRLAGNPDQVIPAIGAHPFMLFGVAVALPPPGAPRGAPAAAAVVASRDRSLGRYSSRVLLQAPAAGGAADGCWGGGVVSGLRGAAKELLIDFYRQNGGRKPEALLVYRGCSKPDVAAGGAGAAGAAAAGPGQLSRALLQAEYDALRA